MRRAVLKSCVLAVFIASLCPRPCAAEDLYPKHIDARTQAAIKRGLDYLAHTQSPDGNWNGTQDGATYPTSMAALAGMAAVVTRGVRRR